MTEREPETSCLSASLSKLISIALTLINDLLDWLNYAAGNPRFERDASGRIQYTPPTRIYTPDAPELHRRYFHRATLRGCGCGYDGLWIFPSQCATLRADVITGTYPGY